MEGLRSYRCKQRSRPRSSGIRIEFAYRIGHEVPLKFFLNPGEILDQSCRRTPGKSGHAYIVNDALQGISAAFLNLSELLTLAI